MKKIITLCAVLLSFLAFTAMQPDNTPEFKFDMETHEFGKIPQGTPVSAEFKFTNVGVEPLIISKVNPTCGCTIADYTKTPVKKGETGFVKLTFNAAVAAPFSKAVTIESNAKSSNKLLYIKGEVISPDVKK